jgi:hypothetical protein
MLDQLDKIMDKALNRVPSGIREPLVNLLYISCVCIAFALICKLAFG